MSNFTTHDCKIADSVIDLFNLVIDLFNLVIDLFDLVIDLFNLVIDLFDARQYSSLRKSNAYSNVRKLTG